MNLPITKISSGCKYAGDTTRSDSPRRVRRNEPKTTIKQFSLARDTNPNGRADKAKDLLLGWNELVVIWL